MQRAPWLEVDWRRHQRWVRAHGTSVNVIELGDGPPLLFVHGLGGSWQNWLEQLPVFAARHRAIAFDLPGFGRSPMPSWPISIGAYVETIEELLDALGIARAAVVGNSMGGLISAELALAAPRRVSHLALISPAGAPLHHSRRRVRTARMLYPLVARTGAWVAAHAEELARRPRLRAQLMSVVAHHPGRIAAPFAAEQLRGVGKPAFWPALEATLADPVTDRLSAISCPAVIVWGARDRVLPAHHAELFAAAIGGARKVIYPDTAHVAMFERPTEVNALIAELLAEAPPAEPGSGAGAEAAPGALLDTQAGERS